jgi:hypothetical protein
MSYQVQKIKAELESKVRQFQKDIKEWEANGLTKQDAREQMDIIFQRMTKSFVDFEVTEFEQDAMAANEAYNFVDSYRDTIRSELFHFEAKYVLCRPTDSLVSPAGVSPDTYVFVRPSVCVQVDELPEYSNLVYFERDTFQKQQLKARATL